MLFPPQQQIAACNVPPPKPTPPPPPERVLPRAPRGPDAIHQANKQRQAFHDEVKKQGLDPARLTPKVMKSVVAKILDAEMAKKPKV
jgi:hypothetical protein